MLPSGSSDDVVVAEHLAIAPARQLTFGAADADYRLETIDGRKMLVGPHGVIAAADAMRRSLPHDLTNALAASALVLETGLATPADIQAALATFTPPRHRLELIGESARSHVVQRLKGDDAARRVNGHSGVRVDRAHRWR